MNKQITSFNVRLDRRQVFWFLVALIGSAAILRLMIGYTAVHYFDLSFYVDWSAGAAQDLFDAYNQVENLDYPPLFLFPLFLTGKLMGFDAISSFDSYAMLALKGWQMLFDLAIIPLLYCVLRREGELFGLGAAALWAVNPTIIYNSSYWGQTDCIMMFLLVLTFWLLTERKPVWAGFFMTLACLMKFQSLYFAPLFAIVLLTQSPLKKSLQTIVTGLVTALAVFFPFMQHSGWMLPWEIYFGGFKQYPGAALNAFNLYSANGLNYHSADTVLIGSLTAETCSYIFIVAALVMLVFLYFTATEKSVWLLGFIFMQTIFLFTTRMHERYQVPVVIFALIACVYHKSKGMFASYLALTLMTFLNHFFVLEEVFSGDEKMAWLAKFDRITVVMSYINIILYVITVGIALRVLYRHGHYGFSHGFRSALPEKWHKRETPPPEIQTDES
ncbi:glycosyltransferase 87 family protein [Oscillospiraceae bacterium PP1C4]